MLLLALLALAFLVALLSGGKLRLLAGVRLKWSGLVLASLAIQIAIFSRRWASSARPWWRAVGYVSSMGLLVLVAWRNRRLPGIPLLSVGLALNTAAIAANGGHMPASPQALALAGLSDLTGTSNSTLMTPDTILWFLGDVLAIPSALPLANVFSIGDILLTAGAIWFLIAAMTGQAKDHTPPEPRPDH